MLLTDWQVEVVLVTSRQQSEQRRQRRPVHRVAEVVACAVQRAILEMEAHIVALDDATMLLATGKA